MELIVLREHGNCLSLRCGAIFVEAFRQAVGIHCICRILLGRRTTATTAAAVPEIHTAIHTTIPVAQVSVTLVGVIHTASICII